MLLRVHAASLNASKLNCIFFRTLDGQGYGKFFLGTENAENMQLERSV